MFFSEKKHVKKGEAHLAHNLGEVSAWSASSKAGASWQKGLAEQSCSVHGSREAGQGTASEKRSLGPNLEPKATLHDPPKHTQQFTSPVLGGAQTNPVDTLPYRPHRAPLSHTEIIYYTFTVPCKCTALNYLA